MSKLSQEVVSIERKSRRLFGSIFWTVLAYYMDHWISMMFWEAARHEDFKMSL